MKRSVIDLMSLVEDGTLGADTDSDESESIFDLDDEDQSAFDCVSENLQDLDDVTVAQEAICELMVSVEQLKSSSPGYRKLVALNIKNISMGISHIKHNDTTSAVSLESVSLEEDSAFDTFLKYLWKTIVYIVKNIWDAIASVFSSVLGSVGRLRRAARALQEKVDKLGVVHASKPVNYKNYLKKLAVNGHQPTSVNDVLSTLTLVTDVLTTTNTTYQKLLIDTGNKLLDGVNRFNAYNATESLKYINDCAEIYTLADPNYIFKSHRVGDSSTYEGPALPGNRCIRIYLPRRSNDDANTTAIGIAHSNRSTKFMVEMQSNLPSSGRDITELHGIDTSYVSRIASNVVAICDIIDNIQKKNIKPLIELKDKLSAATIRAEQDSFRRTDVNKELSECIAATMRYNAAFSTWSTQLQVGVIKNAMETSRNCIQVCNQFLKAV